jgi:hypothetical protein
MAKRRKPNRNPDHGKGLLKRLAERPINAVAVQGGKQEQFILMDIDVTWDVMSDPVLEALPMATQDRIQEVFELVQEKPQSVIQELRDLAALYPNVPSLTNWLINALRAGTMANRCEAMELCQALFRKMPDYFFARTTLADLWLDEGAIEKAAELLFGPGCVLTQLYPDRKVFHISEIRHWFYLCARAKILLGEPRVAESYRDILEQLEPDSQGVRHLNEMLNGKDSLLTSMLANFKKLTSKGRGW